MKDHHDEVRVAIIFFPIGVNANLVHRHVGDPGFGERRKMMAEGIHAIQAETEPASPQLHCAAGSSCAATAIWRRCAPSRAPTVTCPGAAGFRLRFREAAIQFRLLLGDSSSL